MVFLKNALMCTYKKVRLINQHYLPILMLLYILLYIMLAYLMLFAALSNAVCLYYASSFFSIYFCKCFLFSCFVLVYCHIVCLLHVFTCTMHSAFNLLVFHNFMFTSLFLMKGLCALRRNSTYKYPLLLLSLFTQK